MADYKLGESDPNLSSLLRGTLQVYDIKHDSGFVRELLEVRARRHILELDPEAYGTELQTLIAACATTLRVPQLRWCVFFSALLANHRLDLEISRIDTGGGVLPAHTATLSTFIGDTFPECSHWMTFTEFPSTIRQESSCIWENGDTSGGHFREVRQVQSDVS